MTAHPPMQTNNIQTPSVAPTATPIYSGAPQIFTMLETDLFSAYVPVVNQEFKYTWKASKLPLDIWCEMIAFHSWSNKNHFGDETQGDLYYNAETKEWRSVVFPQIGQGLSTKEDDTRQAEISNLRDQYLYPWYKVGTHHNHCNANAFQSGTDKNDENQKPGLHITFGLLSREVWDFHMRAVVQKYHYNCNSYWVEFLDVDTEAWLKHPLIRASINKLKFNNLTLSVNGKVLGTPKTWNRLNNLDKFKLLLDFDVDPNILWPEVLLSLKPDLKDYTSQIEVWDSMVKKRVQKTTVHPNVYSRDLDLVDEYSWYQNQVGSNNYIGSKKQKYLGKKYSKTIQPTQPNPTVGFKPNGIASTKSEPTAPNKVEQKKSPNNVFEITLEMLSEHFDGKDKAILKALWPLIQEQGFNMELILFKAVSPMGYIVAEDADVKKDPVEEALWKAFDETPADSWGEVLNVLETVKDIIDGVLV